MINARNFTEQPLCVHRQLDKRVTREFAPSGVNECRVNFGAKNRAGYFTHLRLRAICAANNESRWQRFGM